MIYNYGPKDCKKILCVVTGCCVHLIYSVNLHICVLFLTGSTWMHDSHNVLGSFFPGFELTVTI